MTGNLDWKWIGIGVAIMLVLSILAGLMVGLFLAPELEPGNLIAGGLVPFLAGVLGGWLGERRQASGSPPSP